jgi:hypothetical protein
MSIDADLRHIDPAIQKVEFKFTVSAGEEPEVEKLLAREGAAPQRRKVYFYDTRDLALYDHSLVLRARVTQGDDDDSTVKLRPVDLTRADAAWRRIEGIRIELDVVGDKGVQSAKLDGAPDRGEIEAVAARRRSVGALFSARQEQLFAAHAPDGASLHELEVLGPVDARKWDLDELDGFAYTLGVEEWSLPDATRFIELSFKTSPEEARSAQTAFRVLLAGLRIDAAADQTPKTPRVLRYFAERLDRKELHNFVDRLGA